MRTLTNADLKTAILKAHTENRLQAQVDPSPHATCVYVMPEKPDCGCAIGVSLAEDEREQILAEPGGQLQSRRGGSRGIHRVVRDTQRRDPASTPS